MMFKTIAHFVFLAMLACLPMAASQEDDSIYLAGLLDTTAYWWAEDVFRFTVESYNEGYFKDINGVPLNNRPLTYDLADSACDEMEAIRAYWQLRTANGEMPPDGVVGCRCSGASLSLARLTSVENVPQVSPSSTSAKLSDRNLTTFSRLVAPQDERGDAAAMVALLRSFAWQEIAILTTDKLFAIDWETNLRKLWIGPHNDSSGSWYGEVVYNDNIRLDASGQNIDPESVRQTLENFPANRVRVIVLLAHNIDAYHIIQTALEMDFQPDTVWIGTDIDENLSWEPENAPGFMGLTPYRNRNQYSTDFKESFDSYLVSRGQEPWENLPVFAAQTVDSIVLLARAIDLAREQPGSNVTSVLRNIVYEPGVSGPVEFTELGDRKNPLYTVLNVGKDGKWNEVGTASTTAATANIQLEKVCWATYGCGLDQAPADAYPQPKIKLPVWILILLVIVIVALLALAIKYWLSRQSKKRMRHELEKLQKSVVGMRAAKCIYIPKTVLENEDLRQSIESNAAPRLSSWIMSASLHSSGIAAPKEIQWCWQETDFRMETHDDDQVFGDRSNCWIKYDDQYNDMIETAFQQQSGTGKVALDPLGYIVDFDAMTQTKNSTGFVRKVMRHEEKDSSIKDGTVTSGTDMDSLGPQLCSDLPLVLRSEPQMVLVEGDIIQISKQRDDGWAFGTKVKQSVVAQRVADETDFLTLTLIYLF
jgi:ABC-type branched-subunit amino acid transport system substrate-binding protein